MYKKVPKFEHFQQVEIHILIIYFYQKRNTIVNDDI